MSYNETALLRVHRAQPKESLTMHIGKSYFSRQFHQLLFASTLAIAIGATSARAQSGGALYNPVTLPSNEEVEDVLSDGDIPTGQGGFARDYLVSLQEGDHILIELKSESFDPIVSLIGNDGLTVAENDDGPNGTTDSLLFSRIAKSGKYVIRVRSFGETGLGNFNLKVTRLKPVP